MPQDKAKGVAHRHCEEASRRACARVDYCWPAAPEVLQTADRDYSRGDIHRIRLASASVPVTSALQPASITKGMCNLTTTGSFGRCTLKRDVLLNNFGKKVSRLLL